jgi:predicted metalloendopeptidase
LWASRTLGENIGDNGGINIAFRALQISMKSSPLGVKDGFTPEQRFFLAYGRVWAGNCTPEFVDYIIKAECAFAQHGPREWCPADDRCLVHCLQH